MPIPSERVFVLEIAQKPILAFRAQTLREALELGRETWLRDDLCDLSSNGVALWDRNAKITTREAASHEILIYEAGVAKQDNAEDLALVFLVELD